MLQEQFNLNWHTYSDHLKELMENLMNSNKTADVTLVCDDKTKFKAHKFVLSACSPLFQSIIDELPHKEDSVIYLRGVQPQEMKSILQFMYLGQATFYQDRMNEFLNVAKSLEIKEISKDVECDNVDSIRGKENDEHNQVDKENEKNDISFNSDSYVVEEIDQTNTKVTGFKDEAGKYQCSKCENQYSNHQSLWSHKKSVHEGIRYPCNKCNQSFTQKPKLRIHIESVHEEAKFPCDLCDRVFTQRKNLYRHQKNDH